MKITRYFLLSLLIIPGILAAQDRRKIDSLQSALEATEDDSALAITSRRLFNAYILADIDSAELYANSEMAYAKKSGITRYEGDAFEDLARIAWQRNQLPDAIKHLQSSLEVREKENDQRGIANCENNIGIIYWNMKSLDKALEHYRKSLAMRLQMNDSSGIAASYGNISLIYRDMNNDDSSYYYIRKSTVIREKQGDPIDLAIAYNNLGTMFLRLNEPDSAIRYFEKCIPLYEVSNDRYSYAGLYNNLGAAFRMKKDYVKAREYQVKAEKISIEFDDKDVLKNAYGELASISELEGDFKSAYHYYRMKDSMKDIIFNDEMTQQVAEAGEKYESEKRQRENDQLKAAAEQDAMLKNFLFVGVGLGAVVAGSMFYAYRNKRKSNHQLAIQNAQIESQKKEITDSINYAQRIQQAILPPVESLKKHFPDSFLFYLPKAIVSGDFWWMIEKDNHVFLAIADCTGHGVPGAFMSMLGMEMLNDIARETADPSEILSRLSKAIKRSLRQTTGETQSRDGMDICLLSFDTKINSVVYAGANRPLWIRKHNGEVVEIAPTKAPIGGPAADDQQYASHELKLSAGDTLYMFTDGYADQFGGDKGKKLKTSGLRSLLESYSLVPMAVQERELEGYFHRWRGTLEQVDDVLICGIRV